MFNPRLTDQLTDFPFARLNAGLEARGPEDHERATLARGYSRAVARPQRRREH